MTAHDAPRRAACDVVLAVEEQSAYANLLLPSLLRERGITGRDAAFATELAYGTLRFLGSYDAVIAECSARPLGELDPPLRAALRVGTHQLLGMRVPAHAAVAATVSVARAMAGHRVAGYANAVLRKVAGRSRDQWLAAVAPTYEDDPLGHLAVVHGHPRWIVEVFSEALGGDLDETARACAADNVAPAVHLVAKPGRCTREALLAQLGSGAKAGQWSPYAVAIESGEPGAIEAVRSGAAGVQDEGSQLAALAVVHAAVEAEQRWLDVCAGPGGKAALLAGIAETRGATLLASDIAQHRSLLTRGAIGPRAGTLVVTADGTRPAWARATFDRVLVDAPCTGLGALRRRPDARWRRVPADADRLHALQVALLDEAATATRPGGVVVYVTCSPHPAETGEVVAEVLELRGDLACEPVRGPLADVPGCDAPYGKQLWPHRHATDAMYVATLRRSTR
ncbi:MAG: RsmB/NOP family class I SAM-dependent RNA methyltransferase [Actinomycetes bacterium]